MLIVKLVLLLFLSSKKKCTEEITAAMKSHTEEATILKRLMAPDNYWCLDQSATRKQKLMFWIFSMLFKKRA